LGGSYAYLVDASSPWVPLMQDTGGKEKEKKRRRERKGSPRKPIICALTDARERKKKKGEPSKERKVQRLSFPPVWGTGGKGRGKGKEGRREGRAEKTNMGPASSRSFTFSASAPVSEGGKGKKKRKKKKMSRKKRATQGRSISVFKLKYQEKGKKERKKKKSPKEGRRHPPVRGSLLLSASCVHKEKEKGGKKEKKFVKGKLLAHPLLITSTFAEKREEKAVVVPILSSLWYPVYLGGGEGEEREDERKSNRRLPISTLCKGGEGKGKGGKWEFPRRAFDFLLMTSFVKGERKERGRKRSGREKTIAMIGWSLVVLGGKKRRTSGKKKDGGKGLDFPTARLSYQDYELAVLDLQGEEGNERERRGGRFSTKKTMRPWKNLTKILSFIVITTRRRGRGGKEKGRREIEENKQP